MRPCFTLWFTGLPGSGKSTLASRIAREIEAHGHPVHVLDGDDVRANSTPLGFTKGDRDLNVRRIGRRCEELCRARTIAIAAVISPYAAIRDEVRRLVTGSGSRFLEVFVRCPLEVLIARDPKGLYRRAIAGELQHFTGISDPYEEPINAELTLESGVETVDESVARIVTYLTEQRLLGKSGSSQ